MKLTMQNTINMFHLFVHARHFKLSDNLTTAYTMTYS